MHVTALCLYFFWWMAYEISYELWEFDTDYKYGHTDTKLTNLAIITLCYNFFSIFLGLLLFYMVLKMTHPVHDEYYDPVLKRYVPFFVYLASCKHVVDHFDSAALPSTPEFSPTATPTEPPVDSHTLPHSPVGSPSDSLVFKRNVRS